MDPLDVEGYLTSKGVAYKVAGAHEVNTACFYCGEDPSKRGRLYINTDPSMEVPGLFMCHLCGERGGLNKIRKFFGDPPLDSEGDSHDTYDDAKHRILASAAEYYFQTLGEYPDAYKYLREDRGLEFETIERHKLGWADGGLGTHLTNEGFSKEEQVRSGLVRQNGYDFLRDQITIPYFVAGNVVTIRGKDIGGKYKSVSGHKAYLYNSDVVWNRPEQVVICEGEFDALVVEQMGYGAVGLPGATTWQENWTGYMDSELVGKIYVCFDVDDAGRKGAEKTSQALGGRAKIIELPPIPNTEFESLTSGMDITDWIVIAGHDSEDFDALMRRSKGGMLISVREAYEQWLEIEGNPDLSGLKFGMSRLDEAIKPGILPGQVVVTLAKTGAGKTISMLNFMHRMKREQPTRKFLFVSLEQTRNEWFERARRIHKFYEPSASIQDTILWWEQNFMMVDANRVSEAELYNVVDQYVDERGGMPDLICIDYLGYWARGFKGDSYERTGAAIMSCKAIGKDLKVPIYAPHQVSRMAEAGEEPGMDAARDSGVIEETADFVFALWSEDQKKGVEQHERTGGVNMKVLKSRHGGVGTVVNMCFTPKTLAMIPENDPLHYKALDEVRLARVGDDLDTVVFRNLTGWEGTIMTDDIRDKIAKLKAEGQL